MNGETQLVAQPHGGALKRGGTNPNAGRRPAIVRKRALQMFVRNLPVLDAIARGVQVEFQEGGALVLKSPRPGEQVAAMKLLKETGLGAEVNAGDVRERLRAQVNLIRSRAQWSTDELLDALDSVWA